MPLVLKKNYKILGWPGNSIWPKWGCQATPFLAIRGNQNHPYASGGSLANNLGVAETILMASGHPKLGL
jgi:hypothetical protein